MPLESSEAEILNPDAIRQQLERILASPYFQNAEQLRKFLRFIVEAHLAGRTNHLKQYTIAVKALDRPKNFNPTYDPIIRVEARRLRSTLAQYYDEQGRSDPIRIEMPKGSYVPVIRANNPPLATVISCPKAFPPKLSPSIAPDYCPSILVLPFTFFPEAGDYAYIANGLLEQLIVILTQFQEFKVIGPLLPDKLALASSDWSELGDQYQSQFILHGSSYIESSQLRIIFKLIDATNNQIVWAETYEHHHSSRDIFAFQDRIARQIAATVADSFGVIIRTEYQRIRQHPPSQFKVYDAVLRYYHHFTVLTEKSWLVAYEALEEAVKLDPDYALTHAMLADLYSGEYHLMGAGEEKLEHHEALVEKALTLDPYCQLAHLMKANTHFFRKQRHLFLSAVEETLKLNSYHANTLFACGMFLTFVGKWVEGVTLVQEAMSLNPHYPGWYHIPLCLNYYRRGAFEQALVEADHCNTPGLFLDPLLRAAVLGRLGRTEEASVALKEMSRLLPKLNLRELLSRTFFSEENVEILLEGLYSNFQEG